MKKRRFRNKEVETVSYREIPESAQPVNPDGALGTLQKLTRLAYSELQYLIKRIGKVK